MLKKLPVAERAKYADEIAAAQRAADEEEAAVKEALYTDLRSLRKQCTAMMGRKGSVRPDGVKLSSAPVSPPVSPPPPAKRSSS